MIDCRECREPGGTHLDVCPTRAGRLLTWTCEIILIAGCAYLLTHIAVWVVRGFPIRP